jgi:hypothetical protein
VEQLTLSPTYQNLENNVNVRDCPMNCKLSETYETLEGILAPRFGDSNFQNWGVGGAEIGDAPQRFVARTGSDAADQSKKIQGSDRCSLMV